MTSLHKAPYRYTQSQHTLHRLGSTQQHQASSQKSCPQPAPNSTQQRSTQQAKHPQGWDVACIARVLESCPTWNKPQIAAHAPHTTASSRHGTWHASHASCPTWDSKLQIPVSVSLERVTLEATIACKHKKSCIVSSEWISDIALGIKEYRYGQRYRDQKMRALEKQPVTAQRCFSTYLSTGTI